jgi:hypothetical protein
VKLPHDIVYLLRLALCYLRIDNRIIQNDLLSTHLKNNLYTDSLGKCQHHDLILIYMNKITKRQLSFSLKSLQKRFKEPLVPISLSRFQCLQEITRYNKYHSNDIFLNSTDNDKNVVMVVNDGVHNFRIDIENLFVYIYYNELLIHKIGVVEDNQGYFYIKLISSQYLESVNDCMLQMGFAYLKFDQNSELYKAISFFLKKGINAGLFYNQFEDLDI